MLDALSVLGEKHIAATIENKWRELLATSGHSELREGDLVLPCSRRVARVAAKLDFGLRILYE